MKPTHAFFGALMAATGVITLASPATAIPSTMNASPAPASVACRYEPEMNTFPGGFTGSVMVTNTGTEGLTDWRIEFDLPGHAHITYGWNGGFITLSGRIRVMPASWNSHLPVEQSVDLGFTGIQSGHVSVSNVTLNGVSCTPPGPKPPGSPTS